MRAHLVVGEEELGGWEIVRPPFVRGNVRICLSMTGINLFALKVLYLMVRSRRVTVGLHGARWKPVYSYMRV